MPGCQCDPEEAFDDAMTLERHARFPCGCSAAIGTLIARCGPLPPLVCNERGWTGIFYLDDKGLRCVIQLFIFLFLLSYVVSGIETVGTCPASQGRFCQGRLISA